MIKKGDTVAIPEPWIEKVEFKFDLNNHFKNIDFEINGSKSSYEFNFKSVRVENPTVLVVNGKKWTNEKVSSAFFVPKIISD
jgi:hypothetical protein